MISKRNSLHVRLELPRLGDRDDAPQLHIHVEVAFRAGNLRTITVGNPGVNGAAIAGKQGWRVSAPIAAAVAAASWEFAILWHIPNGRMFTIGLLSMIVATGLFEALTLFVSRTIRFEGATPNEHCNLPMVTSCGISYSINFSSSANRCWPSVHVNFAVNSFVASSLNLFLPLGNILPCVYSFIKAH